MDITAQDKNVLRELGARIAEIGNLPVQAETADLWRRLNGLERVRPLVWINEIPWDEMNVDDELTLHCTGEYWQRVECDMRRTLYQWDHMRGDMVVDPVIRCSYVYHSTGYGMPSNWHAVDHPVRGAADFEPLIQTEDDIEKIKDPVITADWDATERNYQAMCEVFDGVLPVEKQGIVHRWFAPWDQLVMWYGITELYTDMMDRPDFVHKAIGRMTDAMVAMLDQWEQQDLLTVGNGNYRVGSGGLGITDELPADDYDGNHCRPKDMWGTSTGQIFSEVSPAMHEEFSLQYERKILERFGLNCYGCCEPLHNKMDLMRTIPRLRRISMSPWINLQQAAERCGTDYVFSSKPSPAVMATDEWRPDQARKNLRETLEATRNNVVELILKDITTVRNEPRRLWEWADIASEEARAFA